MTRPLVLSVLAALAAAASAQTAVSGRVVDAETGEPLPGAHVYLSRTLQGDVADAEGRYRIDGVQPGLHELVASMVGFEAATHALAVRPGRDLERAFRLSPRTEELGEVTVDFDRGLWLRQLDRFRREFLGEGENARQTEVLNPEVLAFEEEGGVLHATAAAPLQIENRALGYRIAYDLVRFEATSDRAVFRGFGRFEGLPAADDRERRRWEDARQETYLGSFQHFVHTLADGDYNPRYPFVMYLANARHRNTPVAARGADNLSLVQTPGRVFSVSPEGRVGALTTATALLLRIDYLPGVEDPAYLRTQSGRTQPGTQVSWVEVPQGVARLDLFSGQAFDPYPVELSGYWGWANRASNWLPRDYRAE